MWDRLKKWFAICFDGIGGHVQIFLALVSNFFGDIIDAVGTVLNDPATVDALHQAAPPHWIGNITKGLAAISIVVKLRNAWKVVKKVGG